MSKIKAMPKQPTNGQKVAVKFTPQARDLSLGFNDADQIDVIGALEAAGAVDAGSAKLWGLSTTGATPGDTLAAGAKTTLDGGSTYGAVTMVANADGRQVIQLNTAGNSAFTALADGQKGTIEFYYIIQMGNNGAYSIGKLIGEVVGENDLADVVFAHEVEISESNDENDLTADASGDFVATDLDTGDILSFQPTFQGAEWSNGDLTEAQEAALAGTFTVANGLAAANSGWKYSVANSSIDFLGHNESITVTYKVKVDESQRNLDGSLRVVGSQEDTITIVINGTNDAPVFTSSHVKSITDTVAVETSFNNVTGDLTATDADANDTKTFGLESGDGYSINATTGKAETTYGELTINANGSYTFVPNAAAINALAAGNNPTLVFNVSVRDQHGLANSKATSTITINITGANEPAPVVVTPPPPPYQNSAANDQDFDNYLDVGLTDQHVGVSLSGSADKWAGSNDADNVDGDGGSDLMHGRGGDDILRGSNGSDDIYGGAGNDIIRGGVGGDNLYGGSGNDQLFGDGGGDNLYGGSGNDTLTGGADADNLWGGTGADKFVFTSGASKDTIHDFSRLEGDSIDFTALGLTSGSWAGLLTETNQLGNGKKVGYTVDANGKMTIKADLDGNGSIDFELDVVGHVGMGNLQASDFIFA
jgi:VCBS repeat-containing protein